MYQGLRMILSITIGIWSAFRLPRYFTFYFQVSLVAYPTKTQRTIALDKNEFVSAVSTLSRRNGLHFAIRNYNF